MCKVFRQRNDLFVEMKVASLVAWRPCIATLKAFPGRGAQTDGAARLLH